MLQNVYMKKLIMVRCASIIYVTFSICKAAILNSVDTDASFQTLLRLNYESN